MGIIFNQFLQNPENFSLPFQTFLYKVCDDMFWYKSPQTQNFNFSYLKTIKEHNTTRITWKPNHKNHQCASLTILDQILRIYDTQCKTTSWGPKIWNFTNLNFLSKNILLYFLRPKQCSKIWQTTEPTFSTKNQTTRAGTRNLNSTPQGDCSRLSLPWTPICTWHFVHGWQSVHLEQSHTYL